MRAWREARHSAGGAAQGACAARPAGWREPAAGQLSAEAAAEVRPGAGGGAAGLFSRGRRVVEPAGRSQLLRAPSSCPQGDTPPRGRYRAAEGGLGRVTAIWNSIAFWTCSKSLQLLLIWSDFSLILMFKAMHPLPAVQLQLSES